MVNYKQYKRQVSKSSGEGQGRSKAMTMVASFSGQSRRWDKKLREADSKKKKKKKKLLNLVWNG